MKKGGIGGGRTITGLHFEKKVNLLTKLADVPGYTVKNNEIYYKGKLLAYSYSQHSLYNDFLKSENIDYKDFVSKKYLPDEAIYVPEKKTFYIIEMKFQNVGGSVDEKLQTCDFKQKIYAKLFSSLGIKVRYAYVLSDYFRKSSFNDAFSYIKEVGCNYYFEELPLSELGFPMPEANPDEYDPQDVELTA